MYGLSMSSIFPTVINLAEHYVSLSGKIVAVIVVCAAAGEMTLPLTLALLFRNPEVPFIALFFFDLTWGTLCLVTLGVFFILVRKKKAQASEFISLNQVEAQDGLPQSSINLMADTSVATRLQDLSEEE